MGFVIFPQAELTINRMDDTVRSDEYSRDFYEQRLLENDEYERE